MVEFAYLLSNDLVLIKQMIDYSLVSSKFTLNGICTGGILNAKDVFNEGITILVVDENSLNNYIIQEFKKNYNTLLEKDIALIYIGTTINKDFNEFLGLFNLCKITTRRGNIFDVLFLLEKIHDQRNKTDSLSDVLIIKHLDILNIKSQVFGFTYLKVAISLKIQNPQMKMNVICDKIAREYRVTSSRVDRCMRTSIETAYQDNAKVYSHLYDFNARPTCKSLITKIAKTITQLS